MRQYNKTYENLFSSDHLTNKVKLNLKEVSVHGMDLDGYISLFQNFLVGFYLNLFDDCVKLAWLRRQFIYHGRRANFPNHYKYAYLNIGFVKFLRRIIGKDIQIINKGKFFSKLETYFNDFFPDFDDENPFKNPEYYKFPFKNVSIDYLPVVWQLEDRLSLLKLAEEQKMSYAVFVDYVINHVYSENDFLKRPRYKISFGVGTRFPFYVKDTDKFLKKKT